MSNKNDTKKYHEAKTKDGACPLLTRVLLGVVFLMAIPLAWYVYDDYVQKEKYNRERIEWIRAHFKRRCLNAFPTQNDVSLLVEAFCEDLISHIKFE